MNHEFPDVQVGFRKGRGTRDQIANICWIIGEGNGTPLQYSCLKNPMGGGAWKPAVRGVAESRTRLSDLAVAAALTCTSTEDVCPSPKIYFLNNLGLVLILTSEFLGLEPSSPRIIP